MRAARPALDETIHQQPALLSSVLERSDDTISSVADALAPAQRVFLSGTGTNSHAAVVGEHLLRSAGLDAYATTNFDFVTYPRRLRPDDAVIILTHTGTTRFGRAALERADGAGVLTIAVTGEGSPLPHRGMRLEVAPAERSDTYTGSYTATLLALAMLAAATGQRLGQDMSALEAALPRVPEIVSDILAREDALRPAADRLNARGRMVLAGAGPNAVTAREGALKVKESSYLTAEGFELETLLHGGLQAVNEGDLAVLIAADGPAVGRVRDAAGALLTIGADLLLIADERVAGALPDEAGIFTYRAVPETLSPIPATVPLQLLAAFAAERRGTNPDNFRYDEPRYREAIESFTL
ncbi:MAG TPA: SIS domain-containing protein [Chloroflexota bacterium]|nr:SIS domain-containing protein [Chloroflexota bacterium]